MAGPGGDLGPREVGVKREQWMYLLAGFAFGVLVGLAVAQGFRGNQGEGGSTEVPSPAGPPAMGAQAPAAGAAPMMAEVRTLKERIAQNPQDLEALVRLGNLFYDASMWPEAKQYYEQALRVRPGDPNVLTDLGICYQGTQEFDRALELFDAASASDPSHWQSVYNAAVVAGLYMGRFDRAEQALARLKSIKPDAPNLARLEQMVAEAKQAGGRAAP